MLEPTRELVVNKVKTTFPQYDAALVLEILDEYGLRPFERERPRVQLAVLFASGGDLDKLRKYVQIAKRDYRDVLMFTPQTLAEYRAWLHDEG